MGRVLGRSGMEVSEIGFGCWAIGGPFSMDGKPDGWGEVDDGESVAAVRRAVELDVSFFDTADVYGAGHRPDRSVSAARGGPSGRPGAGGRRRAGGTRHRRADPRLRWSTEDPQRAATFAGGTHCTAIQHPLNVLADAPAMLAACDMHDLASINNSPLAMGLLTGKYGPASQLPADDVRAAQPWVGYFDGGRPAPAWLTRLDAIREVLTSGGRTLAQGALGWLLARSPRTVPICGIRTVAQAEQNAAVLGLGPLPAAEMTQIARLLDRAGQQRV